MITDAQNILLNHLRSIKATPAAKLLLKCTCQQFVLDYGWWYEAIKPPKQIVLGTSKQCHTNAVNLTNGLISDGVG